MSDRKATLHIEGMDPIELPIYSGSTGPDVIDVRQLVSKVFSLTTQALYLQHPANLKSLT